MAVPTARKVCVAAARLGMLMLHEMCRVRLVGVAGREYGEGVGLDIQDETLAGLDSSQRGNDERTRSNPSQIQR